MVKKSAHGFTLLEVLMAVMVLSGTLGILLSSSFGAITKFTISRHIRAHVVGLADALPLAMVIERKKLGSQPLVTKTSHGSTLSIATKEIPSDSGLAPFAKHIQVVHGEVRWQDDHKPYMKKLVSFMPKPVKETS